MYQFERIALILKYVACLEHSKEPARAGRLSLWKAVVGDETEEALNFTRKQLKVFEEWYCVIFIMLCLGVLSVNNCKQQMKKPYTIKVN